MRILIADDDPVARRLLERTLQRLGHEVVAVTDGSDALNALLDPAGPRLAILDWMMPGMDGIEVCRRVRSENRPGYVYILILTAKTQSEDLIMAMDAGSDDFVSKPFKSQELRARLRAACRILDLEQQLVLARKGPSDGDSLMQNR